MSDIEPFNEFEHAYHMYMAGMYQFGYLKGTLERLSREGLLTEADEMQIDVGMSNSQRDEKGNVIREWDVPSEFRRHLREVCRRSKFRVVNQDQHREICAAAGN